MPPFSLSQSQSPGDCHMGLVEIYNRRQTNFRYFDKLTMTNLFALDSLFNGCPKS